MNRIWFRTIYIILCSALLIVSVFVFYRFYFKSEDIIPETDVKEQETLTEQEPTDDKLVSEYMALIATYDEMLSSPYLLLVNKNNPLNEDFEAFSLVECASNPAEKLNVKAEEAIQQFISECSENGIVCRVTAGYRDSDQQNSIYNSYYQGLINAGYTKDVAESMTGLVVSKAGESEFETGFALKIAESATMTSIEMEESDLFQFVKQNVYKYGFILRYPQGKTNDTGYSFDPFTLRYVGFDGCDNGATGILNHAQYMYENNLSMEEYIDYLQMKKAEAMQNLNILKNK